MEVHGALEDAQVVREMTGVEPAPSAPKEEMYERLADWFEQHAEMELFERLYLCG